MHKIETKKFNSRFGGLNRKIKSLFFFVPATIFVFLFGKYIVTFYPHIISPLLNYLLPFFSAVILILFITPVIIYVSSKFNIEDKQKFFKGCLISTPLLGGVAIYLSFVIVLLLYQPWLSKTQSIFWGGSLIFVLGTIDDIYPLSSRIRLFGQIAAAIIVMSSGLVVSFMPDTIWGNILGILITFTWILGIVNATNFIDGADGLASGLTFISSVFFFLITLHLQQYHVCLITIILAGCCVGFLVFNFKPARIYLGDGGSTFLGFLLACIALYGGWSDKGCFYALGIPGFILSVLIFDMIYITLSRIRNGNVRNFKQWLDYRGRDHLHHRLMNIGFKEEQAVLFIYLICVILGLSALVLEHIKASYPVIVLIFQAVLIFIVIIILMLVGRRISDQNRRKNFRFVKNRRHDDV